jgi:hypothetical protein
MKETGITDPQTLRIQGLIDQYLSSRYQHTTAEASGNHLDDDSLSAFAEGRLSPREAEPMIGHLVQCSFCRHITSELVKLDLAFAADTEVIQRAESTEPSKISEVLSGLISRIFGTGEGAVFAHNETEEKDEETEKEEEENKDQ